MAAKFRPEITAALKGVEPGSWIAPYHHELMVKLPAELGGDTPKSIVWGMEGDKSAALVLLQGRLLIVTRGTFGALSTQDLPVASITSVDNNTGATHGSVEIKASGASIKLDRIFGKRDRDFASEVRAEVATAKGSGTDTWPPVEVSAPGPDIITALKELKALHDSGALTDNQFETAKNKLLQAPQTPQSVVISAPIVEPVETQFDVVLQRVEGKDHRKIGVMKEVKKLTGCELKEAFNLVESVPQTILQGVSLQDAESAKAQLESAGGVVSIV